MLGRHGPPLSEMILPDVMGSILEFETPGRRSFTLYITGDTLVIEALQEVPRRYSSLDVALLHLGGTRVLGIMVTMDGRQGVQLMNIVHPNRAIPIHFDDYDVFRSPLDDFKREVIAAGLDNRVTYLNRGERYDSEPALVDTEAEAVASR